MKWSKYSGCGNTFVISDNRSYTFPLKKASYFCNKENVDGLILLEDSDKADYKFRIFNRDGSEAEMCGNGLRSFILFLKELGISKDLYTIETLAGIKSAQEKEGKVLVHMGPCSEILQCNVMDQDLYSINTSVPHAVIFVDDIDNAPVLTLGKKMRSHPHFGKSGTNVNFACLSKGSLYLRTFERGVEGETEACGTGATALALIASIKFQLPSPIVVTLRSKEKLKISFQKRNGHFENVTMEGDAKKLSQGIFVL